MSQGQVGGMYAALMGKKQKQQQNKGSSNASTAKPKASKVIALKDMKETKTAPKKVVEEKKVEAKAPVVEKEKDLTKRETKDERKAGDRSGNRSGHGDAKGKKTNEVEDERTAQDEAGAAAAAERRKEREEEDAARAAKEAEDAKKITYSQYEKQQAEKKAELGVKALEARKVDSKGFAKMATLSKKDDEKKMNFGLDKKTEEPAKKEVKKGGKKEEVKAAPKKNKFVKSADVQLGFFAPKAAKPSGPRRDFKRDEKKTEKTEKTEKPAEATPEAAATEEKAE